MTSESHCRFGPRFLQKIATPDQSYKPFLSLNKKLDSLSTISTPSPVFASKGVGNPCGANKCAPF